MHSAGRRYCRAVIQSEYEDQSFRRINERPIEYRLVRMHLVADVPLGAFLSGGIDSSCVVGLMAKLGVSDIKRFPSGMTAQRASWTMRGSWPTISIPITTSCD